MLCAAVCLTRLPDSAALWLCFVLGDTWSPGLGPLSLPVSSRLLGGLTLQQLLRTASPDEWSGPRRRRGRDQWLLAAFPPCAATTKQINRDVIGSESLTTRSTKLPSSRGLRQRFNRSSKHVLPFTFPEFSWCQSLGSVEEWWRVEVKA